MSSYALEILAGCHSRGEFVSGLESVDRYLRETARSHLEKGMVTNMPRSRIPSRAWRPGDVAIVMWPL